MAMALLSLSAPSLPPTTASHKTSFFHRPYSPITFINYPSKPAIALFSSSSPPPSTAEDEAQASPDAIPVQSESATVAVEEPPFRGCKACGREEVERGCNGEGRIQGGIATVPGFGWWPIKAYRPCPGFVASGGRYTRRGQSMDEVASGGGGRRVSPVGTSTDEPDGSSKKKQGPRKFKR